MIGVLFEMGSGMPNVLENDAPVLSPEEQWRRWVERWTWHLDQVPALLETLRDEAVPLAAFNYDAVRVQTSRDGAPVPFRVDVMDSVDELWAALVLYAENVRDLVPAIAPLPAVGRWRVRSDVAGVRASSDVRRDAFAIVAWLIDHVDAIAPLEQLGDTEDHLFRLVRSLRARYVIKPVRRQRPRPCSLCGEGEVVVRFVEDGSAKGARTARCDVCGEVYA